MKKNLLAILSLLFICGLFAFYIKAILFEKRIPVTSVIWNRRITVWLIIYLYELLKVTAKWNQNNDSFALLLSKAPVAYKSVLALSTYSKARGFIESILWLITPLNWELVVEIELEAEEFCISALNVGSSIFDEQPLVTILRETTRAKVIPPEKVFLFILDFFCKELGNNAVVNGNTNFIISK